MKVKSMSGLLFVVVGGVDCFRFFLLCSCSSCSCSWGKVEIENAASNEVFVHVHARHKIITQSVHSCIHFTTFEYWMACVIS